jgi:hypothetical protein
LVWRAPRSYQPSANSIDRERRYTSVPNRLDEAVTVAPFTDPIVNLFIVMKLVNPKRQIALYLRWRA